MSIILAEAAHCEHVGAYGYEGASHQMGNQIGDELRNMPYYNCGWKYVWRIKNPEVRSTFAQKMQQAVQNHHIGYSQPLRLTLFNALAKDNDPSHVTQYVDCDCSSLVNGLLWYTLRNFGISCAITGKEVTATMPSAYVASASVVEDVTASIDLNTGKGLIQGDILCAPGNHTAAVWKSDSTASTSPKYVGVADAYCKVWANPRRDKLCEWSELGKGNMVDVCDEVGDFFYVRIAGRYFGYVDKKYIRKHFTEGIVITELNLREKPLVGNIICTMKKGEIVQIIGESSDSRGVKWYKVSYKDKTGYCSAKYVGEK